MNHNNSPPKKLKIKKNTDNEQVTSFDIQGKSNSKIDLKNIEKLEKSKNDNEKKIIIDISLLNKNKNQRKKSIIINNIHFAKYNDYELNKLKYRDAILYDKRQYFQYYFSLIKRNNLFIFAFLLSNDYNPKTLKISMFLFSISLYFTMNVVFISDSVIHSIYVKKGSFELESQLPHIIYSIIISATIIGIFKFIFLSEKDIMQIRKVTEKEYIHGKSIKISNYVKCKFILFFITIFLLLFFFWIYVGLFCAVFKNTQIYLIKKTSISYSFYLLYPFVFSFFPGIFRMVSLKSQNKSWMYKISNFLQNI